MAVDTGGRLRYSHMTHPEVVLWLPRNLGLLD